MRLCINCLRGGHHSKICKRGGCSKCGQKHNSLFHFNRNSNRSGQNIDQAHRESSNTQNNRNLNIEIGNEQETTNMLACGEVDHVFLSTALAKVFDSKGSPHVVRALLYCGSQSILVTKSLCDKLKVKTDGVRLIMKGFNDLS